MKISLVSYYYAPPAFGGELIASIERFEALLTMGHETTAFTSGVPNLLREENARGIRIIRSPYIGNSKIARGIRRLIFPLWVVTQLFQTHFDILHLGDGGGIDPITRDIANWLMCKVGKFRRMKIVSVHSLADTEQEMFTEKGLDGKFRKLYLEQCDAIVSVSPALHHAVKKFYPGTSQLIPYGVRDDVFMTVEEHVKNKERATLGIGPQDVVFTFLGTVGYRKGFDLLADAFIAKGKKYSNWHLWVIGPVSKVENQNVDDRQIESLISSLDQHTSKVMFWGRIDDRNKLARLLGLSDVFVFPSRKEGFGIAPLEAMSAGIPVIVSKISGVTDLANVEGSTGFYIEVGDKFALQQAMERLADDPELRICLGKSAHERIKSEFGWQKHIKEWEGLYFSLLGS